MLANAKSQAAQMHVCTAYANAEALTYRKWSANENAASTLLYNNSYDQFRQIETLGKLVDFKGIQVL